MSSIQDMPRYLVLNGISFYGKDINYLKSLFPVLDQVTMQKADVRNNSTMQKALLAEAVIVNGAQATGLTVVLSLSQDGRLLLEKY